MSINLLMGNSIVRKSFEEQIEKSTSLVSYDNIQYYAEYDHIIYYTCNFVDRLLLAYDGDKNVWDTAILYFINPDEDPTYYYYDFSYQQSTISYNVMFFEKIKMDMKIVLHYMDIDINDTIKLNNNCCNITTFNLNIECCNGMINVYENQKLISCLKDHHNKLKFNDKCEFYKVDRVNKLIIKTEDMVYVILSLI
jgi:hypothetical protein